MSVRKGPSATTLSFMIVGVFFTPIFFAAGTAALVFASALSQ
jgi:hypothetical protein